MRFFGALGWALVKLRYVVVLFWAVVAVLAFIYLPPLAGNTTGSLSDLVPESAPAAQAQNRAESSLPGSVEPPALLVYSNPGGFSASDIREMRSGLRQLNNGPESAYRLERAVPLSIAGGRSPTRVDQSLTGQRVLPVLLFFEGGISPTGIMTGTEQSLDVAETPGPLRAEITGVTPIQDDTNDAIQNNLELVTVATAAAIFLIVALTYRSLLAPLVPLASIGLSTFLTLRALGWLAVERGFGVPSQVEPIIVVLLFGVGTDYALFLLSRTRQALREGRGRVEAARIGVERVGGVLISSAAVLIAAFVILILADLSLYRALGPGLAFALSLLFLVTLTLVPALLAILGPAAFGGRGEPRRRDEPLRRGPLRRPGLVAGGLVAMLLVASLGSLGLKIGFNQIANLPQNAPSAQGYTELTREFPGGILAPVNVVVRGENLDEKGQELRQLEEEFQQELLLSGGYTETLGPRDAQGITELDFVAEDGSAARILVIFYANPYAPQSLDLVERLEGELPAMTDRAGLDEASASVAGQTAFAADARDTSGDDLRDLAPLIFGAAFVVLALLLRTPVAPLYLLGSTALSFTATMGICTLLFQDFLGQGGVVYYVPFALFLLLIALGSDYNIFIMAAICEEAEEKPLKEAVPAALMRTGPTINAAGLALAASFFLLTLIPLRDFFQIGVAMALGILLDAFVIRTLLVPSLVLLAGRWGFWPQKKVRP